MRTADPLARPSSDPSVISMSSPSTDDTVPESFGGRLPASTLRNADGWPAASARAVRKIGGGSVAGARDAGLGASATAAAGAGDGVETGDGRRIRITPTAAAV